jgi:DNA uptake protein ComE-like DNA-binding protein
LRPSLSPSRKKGAVFLISLWILVILSILSAAIASLVWPQIKLAKVIQGRFSSLAAAEAALKHAFFSCYQDPTPEYDCLSELNKEVTLELDNASATYHFTDEESKININTADKEVLMRLPGMNDESVAGKIIEYRNDKVFALKEELLLVPGVDEELFNQIKDLVTVWTDGRVNLNTASEPVLRALGLSDDLVALIMRFRREGVFADINTVINDLRRFSDLTVQQIAQLQNVLSQDLLTVKSQKFNILVQTKFLNKPTRNFHISFSLDDSQVLQWNEP